MKYFVIIPDHILVTKYMDASGFDNSAPIPILKDDDSTTGFSILGILDSYNECFSGYIKMTSEEVAVAKAKIASGYTVDTKVHEVVTQAAHTESSSKSEEYRGIGIVTTSSPTSTWVASSNCTLAGVYFNYINAEVGDTIKFELLASDNSLLGTLAPDWYLWEGPYQEKLSYFISTGQKIKITLDKGANVGSSTLIMNGRFIGE